MFIIPEIHGQNPQGNGGSERGGKLNAHNKTHNGTLNSYTHTHIYNSHSILKKNVIQQSLIFAARIMSRTAGEQSRKFRYLSLSVTSPLI